MSSFRHRNQVLPEVEPVDAGWERAASPPKDEAAPAELVQQSTGSGAGGWEAGGTPPDQGEGGRVTFEVGGGPQAPDVNRVDLMAADLASPANDVVPLSGRVLVAAITPMATPEPFVSERLQFTSDETVMESEEDEGGARSASDRQSTAAVQERVGAPDPRTKLLAFPQEKLVSEAVMLKSAVEKIMISRIARQKQSSKDFRMDCCNLVLYLAFLALLTVTLMVTDSEAICKGKIAVEQAVSEGIREFGSGPPFSVHDVKAVDDIYTYLIYTLVPATTVLPSTRPPLLCNSTQGPADTCTFLRPGLLANGANQLMRPPKVRQLRVRAVGNAPRLSYPPFSDGMEESRNGGGTLLDEDPLQEMTDWPDDRVWYAHERCVATPKDSCFVDDGRVGYGPGGYALPLSKSSDVVDLQRFAFLSNKATRAVFVELAAAVSYRQLVCTATVLFQVTTEGRVEPSVRVRCADLEGSTNAQWRTVFLALVGVTGLLLMIEFFCMVRGKRRYFNSGWNYISLANYSLVIYSLFLRETNLDLQLEAKSINPLATEAERFPFHEVLYNEDSVHAAMAFSAFLSWLRLIRYVEPLSPSTRQLIRSIKTAANRFGSGLFFIMFVFFGGGIAFRAAFGRSMSGFATIQTSLSSLLVILSGQGDVAALLKDRPDEAPTLIVLVGVCLLGLGCLLIGITAQSLVKESKEWSQAGGQEITFDRTLGMRRRELASLLRARNVEEFRKDIEAAEAELGQAVMSGEYLTRREFLVLFSKDTEALERMGVRTVDELLCYVNTTGDERLPTHEVRQFREDLLAALHEKELLEEEIRQSVEPKLDAEAVERVVEGVVSGVVSRAVSVISESLERLEQGVNARMGRGGRKAPQGAPTPGGQQSLAPKNLLEGSTKLLPQGT